MSSCTNKSKNTFGTNRLCALTAPARLWEEAAKLLSHIKALCAQVTDEGTIAIEFYSEGAHCHVRTARVSLTVTLQWANFDCELVVREFDRRLAVPARGEQPIYVGGQPRETRVARFLPDLNRAREFGWIEQGQSSRFVTCDALANQVIIQLVDLAERADRGEFRSSTFPRPLARRRR